MSLEKDGSVCSGVLVVDWSWAGEVLPEYGEKPMSRRLCDIRAQACLGPGFLGDTLCWAFLPTRQPSKQRAELPRHSYNFLVGHLILW